MSNIEELNEDPEFYIYMTEEEDRRKIYNTEIHQAERKGLEQGVKQSAIAIAKKMIAAEEKVEKIQKFTDLPLKEIEKLKEELSKKENKE